MSFLGGKNEDGEHELGTAGVIGLGALVVWLLLSIVEACKDPSTQKAYEEFKKFVVDGYVEVRDAIKQYFAKLRRNE